MDNKLQTPVDNSSPADGPASVPSAQQKLQRLLGKSIDTLETMLDNPELPTRERAELAFQILQMGAHTTTVSTFSTPARQVVARSVEATYAAPAPVRVAETRLEADDVDATDAEQIATDVSGELIFIPAHYVRLDDFLLPGEYQHVLETTFRHAGDFVQSTTLSQSNDHRNSTVLWTEKIPDIYQLLKEKLLKILPQVLRQLQRPAFPIARTEMQLTAHHDGCYYKLHRDAGTETTLTRQLTFVYYFYREPKSFSGGELKLFDTEIKGTDGWSKEGCQLLEPRNNSIIFFDSRNYHEVLPVRCPSDAFEDGRFTLNGWIRRLDKVGQVWR